MQPFDQVQRVIHPRHVFQNLYLAYIARLLTGNRRAGCAPHSKEYDVLMRIEEVVQNGRKDAQAGLNGTSQVSRHFFPSDCIGFIHIVSATEELSTPSSLIILYGEFRAAGPLACILR